MQWEAHRCVLRVHLFSIVAWKKKEHQSLLLELSNKVSKLEAQLKRTQALQSTGIGRNVLATLRRTFQTGKQMEHTVSEIVL